MAAALQWTEERLSVVKHLLVTEGLTRAAIAERVGVSRSAVVHVISRYRLVGLSRHNTPAKPVEAKPQRINGFRPIAPIAPGRLACDLPIESSPNAKCWECFDPKTDCHWPLGKDGEGVFQFCGRKRFLKQSSYCWRHHKRSRAREDSNRLSPPDPQRASPAAP